MKGVNIALDFLPYIPTGIAALLMPGSELPLLIAPRGSAIYCSRDGANRQILRPLVVLCAGMCLIHQSGREQQGAAIHFLYHVVPLELFLLSRTTSIVEECDNAAVWKPNSAQRKRARPEERALSQTYVRTT